MGRAGKKSQQSKQSVPDAGIGYGFGGFWQGGGGWDYAALPGLPPMGQPWPFSGPAVAGRGAETTTESLLDALADSGAATAPKKKSRTPKVNYDYSYQPSAPPPRPAPAPQPQQPQQQGSTWVVAPPRDMSQPSTGFVNYETLLGNWVDTQGHFVSVMVTDAFAAKLLAVLSKPAPARPEIHLSIRPVMLGGGWQCGHSLLDPMYSTENELHWVTVEGRVSVWVRRQDKDGKASGEAKASKKEKSPKKAEDKDDDDNKPGAAEPPAEAEAARENTKKTEETDSKEELREPAAAEAAAAAQADQAEAADKAG
mmetsp:Transcript_16372/g.35789  ORF Transcript_16372/g.35789 Transcript_16372/m.35789 type:complete len:311 (+) Transcript_16372:195-1127(+)